MATLTDLKFALTSQGSFIPSPEADRLSDSQYAAGFSILTSGQGRKSYESFIIPQLSSLFGRIISSRGYISVLEIGPGPRSVLGDLPHFQRGRIKRYVALEPDQLFADRLRQWLHDDVEIEREEEGEDDGEEWNDDREDTEERGEGVPFWLITNDKDRMDPEIRETAFTLVGDDGGQEKEGEKDEEENGKETEKEQEKFDIILFCHSMYGMKPHRSFIERALEMLDENGMVILFHRDGELNLDKLVCTRTASFPTGIVSVEHDDDDAVDDFAAFIAGYPAPSDLGKVEWRKICRKMGTRDGTDLIFSSPEIMLTFTRHATALKELEVGLYDERWDLTRKNWATRGRRLPGIAEPKDIGQVQECVRWALRHGFGLTVLGGGHSAQCLVTGVVAVDVGAFKQIHHCLTALYDGSLLVAGAGCTTEDIVKQAKAWGKTVPLGSRPSVGAGLWLQGGIGHLSRLHGLACDSLVGAVLVSLVDGNVLYVGEVPPQHRPVDATRAENEDDLLWALKGAGTNFGIVISVSFRTYPAPKFAVWNWINPLSDKRQARLMLSDLDTLMAKELARKNSADGYLFWDDGQMRLGVTLFEVAASDMELELGVLEWGVRTKGYNVLARPEDSSVITDGVGLFNTEMYMSMHGGHGGGKTSSFKRCVFLKTISEPKITKVFFKALETRPTPHCYLHLLHSGGTGAVADVPAHGTAFGCRDWEFACVVTGVWPRDQDGTAPSRNVVKWVYDVVGDLLPMSQGIYGADLGPDPRDAALAAKAFGPNRPRLARLKQTMDPCNVLRYACPLPEKPMDPRLIILVTGEHGAGKDYFARVCESTLKSQDPELKVRSVSISYALKRKYAAEGYADLNRLLSDREYKEEHRTRLRRFYNEKCRQRPGLPEEHFLDVVYGAEDVDVLIVTGMRDEAPVAAFGHLVPDSRLIEVRVTASEETRLARRKLKKVDEPQSGVDEKPLSVDYRPTWVFNNDEDGADDACYLSDRLQSVYFNEDLTKMSEELVRSIPDYPRPGITFRHVLGAFETSSRSKWGMEDILSCTTVVTFGDTMTPTDFERYLGDCYEGYTWVGCESGGFILAAMLAQSEPLVLVRGAGKVPPPKLSVVKRRSHISGAATSAGENTEERFEIGRDAIAPGQKVVVVDDVLASGETLCAVLELLGKAGVGPERISVLIAAEFPLHRGRELLRRRGFGGVCVHSYMTFGGY